MNLYKRFEDDFSIFFKDYAKIFKKGLNRQRKPFFLRAVNKIFFSKENTRRAARFLNGHVSFNVTTQYIIDPEGYIMHHFEKEKKKT